MKWLCYPSFRLALQNPFMPQSYKMNTKDFVFAYISMFIG